MSRPTPRGGRSLHGAVATVLAACLVGACTGPLRDAPGAEAHDSPDIDLAMGPGHEQGHEQGREQGREQGHEQGRARDDGRTDTGTLRPPSPVEAFERARRLVSHQRGIDLSAITLAVVDDELIDAHVRHETQRLVERQFSDARYAAHFIDRVMKTQSGTYAALYVSMHRQILVSRRALAAFLADIDGAELGEAALLALMIHEVVHAADDAEHDIDAVRTLDFRAAFTQSAVFEGHAQWATRRLCRQVGCLRGLDALDRFMFGDASTADPLVPASGTLSRNVLEYAYVEGERFVASLAERAQGARDLQRLLGTPPLDPIQILDPDSWPNTERESRNRRLLNAAADAEHPWARGDDTLPARSLVAASPLKGVNLRNDPDRRRAAIDGFTRLLDAMIAIELHDERDIDAVPIAMTLLQADSASTAALFARTLHANTLAQTDRTTASSGELGTIRLLRTTSASPDVGTLRTLVARRDDTVLQLTASDEPEALLDAYARAVFEALPEPASVLGRPARPSSSAH